jgi:hypothetical protein
VSGPSRRRQRKKNAPTTLRGPVPTDLLKAWQRCPASDAWARPVEIRTATWNGEAIGQPAGEDGEAFDIFRVGDSSVITEDELTSAEACRLDWQIGAPA